MANEMAGSGAAKTTIAPWLSVRGRKKAVELYKAGVGATETFRIATTDESEVAMLNFFCQAAAEADGGNFDKAVSEHGQSNGQRPEQQHDGWPWRVGEDSEANVEHDAME